MELGSLVCTPQEPACDRCPLATLCQARLLGLERKLPVMRGKPASEAVREAAVVLWRRNKVFIRQRLPGERWAGLWDFLRFPLVARAGTSLEAELIEKALRESGLKSQGPTHITTLKHGVTRFRITLDCYRLDSVAGSSTLPRGTWRWVRPADLTNFPLSVTGRRLSRLLLADA
jgi:A/G-specific adenine glycosylase